MAKSSAGLRIISQPLWDTECLVDGTVFSQKVFFCVPIGALMHGAGRPKTHLDTNMTQGGALGAPLEFDLCRLAVEIIHTDREDARTVVENGLLQFFYAYTYPIIEVPLITVNPTCFCESLGEPKPDDDCADLDAILKFVAEEHLAGRKVRRSDILSMAGNPPVQPGIRVAPDDCPLKIKHGQNISARISFPGRSVVIYSPVMYIRVVMYGNLWTI